MEAKETLKVWVEEHSQTLYKFAVSKIDDTEIAKDLVQDSFIAAYAGFENYKENSSPRTWLIGILKHKIADHYRSLYKNEHISITQEGTSAFFDNVGMWDSKHIPKDFSTDVNLLDDTEFLYVLNACIGKLPKKLNSAIQLKYYSDISSSQICKDLSITATNFWQMLHRAKLRLRECLEINWFKV